MRFFLFITLLSACSFDGSAVRLSEMGELQEGPEDNPTPQYREHLLLSEVKSTETGSEFVEVLNPTDRPISLGNYYLTDSPDYPLLPAMALEESDDAPVIFSDFIARFPERELAAGDVAVVAIRPSGFFERYGVDFDLAIDGELGGMEEALPGSIGSRASITDSGELIALFHWDGESDLVMDVDLLHAGAELSNGNAMVEKSEVAIDGPDGDAEPTSYRVDLGTMGGMPESAEAGQSYQRIREERGLELQTGQGNGLHGDDETSENIAETWQISDMPTPGVADL